MSREQRCQRLSQLLKIADAIWVPASEDAALIEREIPAVAGRMVVANPQRLTASWLSAHLRRFLARRKRPSVRDVSVLPCRDVLGTNRILARLGARKPYFFADLHNLNRSEDLLEFLLDGMNMMSYAGAALPWAASPLQPAVLKKNSHPLTSEKERVLWRLKTKGDWHHWSFSGHFCGLMVRTEAMRAVGLLNKKFQTLRYAWLDYLFRLEQAGWPVFLAKDCLAFCGNGGLEPRKFNGVASQYQRDRELLTDKWSRQSLRFMEILGMAVEPQGYRDHPTTQGALQGNYR